MRHTILSNLNSFEVKELPLVSVITVVYNEENSIEDTIKSVLSQSYPKLEYIIIDGASDDKTVSIIKRYSDQIHFWCSEKDYDAMNKGISKANGEIIHLLNSADTYIDKNTISNVVQEMGDARYFTTKVKYIMKNRNVILEMDKNNISTIPHPGLFVKKVVYEDKLFDLSFKYASDLDFILKIKENYLKNSLGIISVNMPSGGVGSSNACFQEATKIYLANGYYITFLKKLIIHLKNQIINL